eukprot:GHVL01007700.1.p1 GENE.GHVL01007700.1~~GHVL01007700.1.p1  ORF type:complete len:358 (-),score=113.45 GHVL01007700.1:1099-2172(-)
MIEVKLQERRLKSLRFNLKDITIKEQSDAEVDLKCLEDIHRYNESEALEFHDKTKVILREHEDRWNDICFSLQLSHDEKILEVRKKFDQKSKDLQKKHQDTVKKIRKEREEERRSELEKIEIKKQLQIDTLQKKNLENLKKVKKYYSELIGENLKLIKQLKEEYFEHETAENKRTKRLTDLKRKNKSLKEPLGVIHQEIERLTGDLTTFENTKAHVAELKTSLTTKQQKLETIHFKQEVLYQQLQKFKKQNNAEKRLTDEMFKIKQSTGLKNILLKQQAENLTTDTDITDCQVNQILQMTSSLGEDKLEKIIIEKDSIIRQLQDTLESEQFAHESLVKEFQNNETRSRQKAMWSCLR